jgi:hypothetical protein
MFIGNVEEATNAGSGMHRCFQSGLSCTPLECETADQ